MNSNRKLTKACVPCKKRKVRCDAAANGLPCHRCIARDCASSCFRVGRRPRRQPANASRRRRNGAKELGIVSVAAADIPEPTNAVEALAAQLTHNADSQACRCSVPLSASTCTSADVPEGQAQVEICREMAVGDGLPPSEKMLDSLSPGRDLVEYHNCMHYMTVLGELVGHDDTRRLTRVVIHDPKACLGKQQQQCQSVNIDGTPSFGLGPCELEFLSKRGALSVPSKVCCDKLLRIFFQFFYPYVPVFDRVEFLQSYESGQYSLFLMQAILANATQHAPTELLHACGYEDRLTAQKSLVSNAALLYDLGYERRQLRRLQGSLLLGAAICSFTTDKDFRYWLHNSVRIATRMGLHKKDIAKELDPPTYKLCRRIWWSLYIRDIGLSLTGFRNMRMLDSSDCDTDPLAEDDWEEENIPPAYQSLLPPLTQQHKLWVIESAKLSAIGERCLSVLKGQAQPLAQEAYGTLSADDALAAQFASWRATLPTILLIKPPLQCPNENNVLPIMLMAAAYRYECIVYRILLKQYQRAEDEDRCAKVKQRLRSAMLEMDTLVARAITEELFSLLHLKFMGSIFTVLALRIESVLSPTESELSKAIAYPYIRQSVLYLQQVRDHDLPTIEWTLRLFEWVLDQKGLSAALNLPRHDSVAAGAVPVARRTTDAMDPGSTGQLRDGGQLMPPPFVDVPPPNAEFVNDPGPMFQDLLGFDFLDDLGFSSGI